MENENKIPTDGCLINGKAGAAVYFTELTLSCSLHLGKYVCVYQAELFEPLHAFDHVLEKNSQL